MTICGVALLREQQVARPGRLWLVLCLAGFLALTVLGITNSSIALLDDPADGIQGLLLGHPQSIRSDEWIRFTPIAIGALTNPSRDLYSALAITSDPSSWVMAGVGVLVRPEHAIGVQLGRVSTAVGFAFTWWFPVFLYFAFLPLWLRRLGTTLPAGILVTTIIYFSPPVQWWSLHIVQLLGWSALAAFAVVRATDGWLRASPSSKAITIALTLLAGISLGRLATAYPVWVIPLAPMLLFPTLAFFVFTPRYRWPGLIVSGTAALVGILLGVAPWLAGGGQLATVASTVYPGSRTTAGFALPFERIFGGIFGGFLQTTNVPVTGSNLSEIASGYTLLILCGLAIGARLWPRWDRRGRAIIVVLGSWTTLCFSWFMLTWPAGSDQLFPLNRIVPERMNQVAWVGILLLLGFLVAGDTSRGNPKAWRQSLGLPTAGFLAAGLAGSLLRESHLNSMPIWFVWTSAGLWAAAMYVLVSHRTSALRWIPITVLAVASTAAVNPIQRGFGDLQSSAAAAALTSLDNARPDDGRLAADDYWTSAVLTGNAVETMSGQQVLGPDSPSWMVLDPGGVYVDQWNRGASTILFRWLDEGVPTSIEAIQADTVVVSIDPCSQSMSELGLAGISSGRELTNGCLSPVAPAVSVAGTPKWLYLVD